MAYVALSRVRSLDGVALLSLTPERVSASPLVSSEMERLRHQACSGINHSMNLVSVSKSSYQSSLFSRLQCLSKHRSLLPVKQKCAHTSLPNQHSKGGKKQSVQFHSNAILRKNQLDSSKQLGHSEKNVKQDLATAKEVAPPQERWSAW